MEKHKNLLYTQIGILYTNNTLLSDRLAEVTARFQDLSEKHQELQNKHIELEHQYEAQAHRVEELYQANVDMSVKCINAGLDPVPVEETVEDIDGNEVHLENKELPLEESVPQDAAPIEIERD